MAASLAQRAVHAAKWSYIGNAAKALLQFIAGIFLARLIGPDGFGIAAIAWIMIGFGTLLADAGFGVALIQAPTLTQKEINFAFTVQLAIGALFTALGIAIAGPIAATFGQPDATPVVQAMSAIFFLRAFGQTQTAMMNRHLQYKTTQIINIGSYAIGYFALGVPAAYFGYGAWSLVIAQLIQSLVYSVAINIVSPERLSFQLRPGPTGLARFGVWIMGTNLLNWLLANLDTIVVGNAFGATALGLYNRSFALMSTPMNVSVSAMQSVLMSTVSRAEGDAIKAKRAYVATNQVILAVLAPILLAAAAVPEAIVLGVYGHAWSHAIPLITPLALAMLAHSLMALIGPVLNARGRVNYEFYSQGATLGFSLLVFYHTYSISLEAISWGVLLIYLFRLLSIFIFLSREIPIRILDMLKIMSCPALISAVVVTSAIIADRTLPIHSMTLKLLAIIAFCGTTYLAATIVLGPRLAAGDGGRAIAQGISLPAAVRRWLNV